MKNIIKVGSVPIRQGDISLHPVSELPSSLEEIKHFIASLREELLDKKL